MSTQEEGEQSAEGAPNDAAEAALARLLRDGWRDPYPHYDVLRRVAPVHWSDLIGGWVLTSYDAVHSVLRDPRFERGFALAQSWRADDWVERPSLAQAADSLLNLDGSAHTKLRRLVSRAFGTKTAEAMAAQGESIVQHALDRLEAGRGGDVVAELAVPLAGAVIAELLGVPVGDREVFVDHVRKLRTVAELSATAPRLDAADDAVRRLEGYFEELLAEREREPADDLLSALAEAEGAAPSRQLLALAVLVFTAGVENSANAVSNSLLALAAQPEAYARLRREPELLDTCADELLRYDAPVQLTVRAATEPVEVSGEVIGPGEPVYAVLGAANRDPAVFEHPATLDFRRDEARPVTFGGGVHHCVGFALARAEVDWVVRGVTARFEALAPLGLVYSRHLIVRGPRSFPVVLGAAAVRVRAESSESPETPAPAEAVTAAQSGGPKRGATTGPASRPSADRAGGDHAWRSALRASMEERQRAAEDIEGVADLLAQLDFFGGCTRTELVGLAATSYPLAFEPGEALYHQGEEAVECYLVTEGEAEIVIDGQVAATAGPDDLIGERSLVVDGKRAATVHALTPLTTWAISKGRLQRLTRDNPAALDVMRRVVAARYPEASGAGRM